MDGLLVCETGCLKPNNQDSGRQVCAGTREIEKENGPDSQSESRLWCDFEAKGGELDCNTAVMHAMSVIFVYKV